MSGWAEVFLGVIAVATLAIAIGQIGVMLAAGLLARRLAKLAETVEQDVKPILGHVNSIAADASRATSLAASQVERVDRLFADVVGRLEDVFTSVQSSLGSPAREGRAWLAAFSAAFDVIRQMRRAPRGSRSSRGDDEDALFI